MPALTDEDMALCLDPALAAPKRAIQEDDEALRSQLVANLQQNSLAHAANGLLTNEGDTHVQTAHTTQIEDESKAQEQANGPVEAETSNESSHVSNGEGYDTQARDIEAEEHDAPQAIAEDAALVRTTELDRLEFMDNTEIESKEQDDDDFEDATSNIETIEFDAATNGTAQTTSDVEPEQATEVSDSSDAEDASDDEVDFCLFCDQKEPEERGTTTEELVCTICRRPAHQACASATESLNEDLQSWRCPSCADNRASESPKEATNMLRHSAPRLVRDLLPVSRGVQKPGAHSIFAQPLIQDDEGGRALRRKRRSPSIDRDSNMNKRRKTMEKTPKPEKIEPDPISHSTRRSSQKLAPGLPPIPTARILQHRPFHKPPPHKFILAFRLDQSKIEAILSEPPKPSRRRYVRKKQKIVAPPAYQPPVPKFPALPTHHLLFHSMFGDRENDINAKPYGGILSEAEAETSRSLPQMRDREVFEIARKEAEEERKKTSAIAEAQINGLNGEGANATNSKRTVSGPPSKIKCIQFGKHVIDTSYAAPYPEEYSHESRLFICEFCLKYLPSEFVAWRHKLKCPAKHPPGDEIYRDGSLSVWEVDGRKKTEYCQCLCLMAKLFLGSKTLYYDVDPFLFYVLTEWDDFGYHFVGYFSKEKRPASQNNVSCILVMPIHQRKGYATFLIEFSYLLTRIEDKEGSPEKPLSDMGLTAYRSYWDLTISKHLLELGNKPFSVKGIMARTGMTADDVVHSLERLYAFVKDPVTKTYAIRYDKKLYENIVDKYESKDFRNIKPERLVWTPYIMGRSDAATLDAQPITAVAQREELIELENAEALAKHQANPENVSPRASQAPPQQSTENAMIDPALFKENGNIAPGPPPVDAMNGIQASLVETEALGIATSEDLAKGKAPAESALSGYALAYQVEKIPAIRFQIDPPIPPATLRHAKTKRKSTAGTPRVNGLRTPKPPTPKAVRSSPRKAGSVNGSLAGRASSRATTPDKGSTSIRRSGRRSGLANEIVTGENSGQDDEDVAGEDEGGEEEEDEDEDEDEEDEDEDEEDGGAVRVPQNQDLDDQNSEEASGTDDASSNQSILSEGEEAASDASDDPDAVVEEEEDEEDESNGEEENVEIDIPSAVSSAAASDDEDTEEGTEED